MHLVTADDDQFDSLVSYSCKSPCQGSEQHIYNVTFSQLHVKVPLKKFRNDVFGDSLVMHFCS